MGGTNSEATIQWFNIAEEVLEHMGCPPELWVMVVTQAIYGAGRVWWISQHRPLERIS